MGQGERYSWDLFSTTQGTGYEEKKSFALFSCQIRKKKRKKKRKRKSQIVPPIDRHSIILTSFQPTLELCLVQHPQCPSEKNKQVIVCMYVWRPPFVEMPMGSGVPTGPRGESHRARGSNIPTLRYHQYRVTHAGSYLRTPVRFLSQLYFRQLRESLCRRYSDTPGPKNVPTEDLGIDSVLDFVVKAREIYRYLQ